MGTSSSQGSPGSTAWRAVWSVYAQRDVDADRVVTLIWRAAYQSDTAVLGKQLRAKEIAACAEVVRSVPNTEAALRHISDVIAGSDRPTIAMELARRSAIASYDAPDRVTAFVSNLFSSATRYLVSRDAPSLVGTGERLRTVRDVLRLKDEVGQAAGRVAARSRLPRTFEARAWRTLADRVLKELSA